MAKLFIRNMVCDRCKMAVKKEIDALRIGYDSIELGEVDTNLPLTKEELEKFRTAIEALGFLIIEDKQVRLVNQIKKAAMTWARAETSQSKKIKFSSYLAEVMHKDYASLSHLFSEIENTTLEQFVIHQRIEKAKELLVYDELNLSEIADLLNYSSTSHLSNQFKKITGLTPQHFKKIGAQKRTSLDKI